jgi:hypothetical protein
MANRSCRQYVLMLHQVAIDRARTRFAWSASSSDRTTALRFLRNSRDSLSFASLATIRVAGSQFQSPCVQLAEPVIDQFDGDDRSQ